jgi:DNA invertase Pin-like site-specific DNA recombinase
LVKDDCISSRGHKIVPEYIIYCRKSSESEERQVLSIESQIKELKEAAQRLNLTVSETLTESKSAKYPGRPIFNSLMKKVYQGQLKGIVTWKLDRLARNPIDGSSLVWALDRGKLSEIITPQGIFKNNSNDKFLMQIEFGMAKKYVDDLSDNVKRGNRAKLEKGWLPGFPPLGYLNEPVERTIVKDPERFHFVRKIWDLFLQNVPISRIRKIANEEWGLRSRTGIRTGGKSLSLSNLYKILGNPFYYGLIERKEGVFQGKHEPMIREDEYWKAQALLGRRGKPRPKNHQFAFTGLIRCGECGSMITAEEKVNRYGCHYTYYHCTKKKRTTICHQRYINLNDLEKQILEYLDRIYVPEHLFNLGMGYLNDEAKENNEKRLNLRLSLKKAYDDCQRRLANLNHMRLKDLIDDEEYIREKRKLLEEKIKLDENLKNPNNLRTRAVELTQKTLLFASKAKESFQKGSLRDKRDILQGLGSNLTLKGQKLHILIEKPLLIIEEGLKGIGSGIKWLELQKSGLFERENKLAMPGILAWWATVKDVRTFFEASQTDLNIPNLRE